MPNVGKIGIRPSGLVQIRIRDRVAWREEQREFAAEEEFAPETGAWNIEKVEAFRDGFYEFLGYVRINSKERGGNYCLADGVYEAQYRLLWYSREKASSPRSTSGSGPKNNCPSVGRSTFSPNRPCVMPIRPCCSTSATLWQ